jgi:hypothetical protein
MSIVLDINVISKLTLCELKNLLYKNEKEQNLSKKLNKKSVLMINDLIEYKIKKSHIEQTNKIEIDPIKKITNLLIENQTKPTITKFNYNKNENSDVNSDANSGDSENDQYHGHNKFKNSKKIRNGEYTQTSEKLLNRLLGEAHFRYQEKKHAVIKPYSTQDKEITINLGQRKNIF